MSVFLFPKPSVDQLPSQAGGCLSSQTHSPFANGWWKMSGLSSGTSALPKNTLHHYSSAALSLSYSVLLRGLFCPDRQSTAEAQLARPRWHLHRAWRCPGWTDRWLIHSALLATAWSELPLHLSNISLTTFPFFLYPACVSASSAALASPLRRFCWGQAPWEYPPHITRGTLSSDHSICQREFLLS